MLFKFRLEGFTEISIGHIIRIQDTDVLNILRLRLKRRQLQRLRDLTLIHTVKDRTVMNQKNCLPHNIRKQPHQQKPTKSWNLKHEARNPKPETNPKPRIQRTKTKTASCDSYSFR